MAASVTPFAGQPGTPSPPGYQRSAFATVTGDASYPTGGYALTPQQFGFAQSITFMDPNMSNAAHIITWNSATQKLQFWTAQNTEVANTTNVSTVTVQIQAFGY